MKKALPKKSVANAFVAGRFVAGINDGAEGSFESGIGWRGRRLLRGGTIWKDEWWKDEWWKEERQGKKRNGGAK